MGLAADLFMCPVGFSHVYSLDVRSEGRLPLKQQISPHQFKKLWRPSPLINSQKKNICSHTVVHHSAVYNPHRFGLDLNSDVTEKQVASRFDGTAKDKSTEDHHNAPCPHSKRLSFLGTSVLMMYNMQDD